MLDPLTLNAIATIGYALAADIAALAGLLAVILNRPLTFPPTKSDRKVRRLPRSAQLENGPSN